jgi:hypothetical protein
VSAVYQYILALLKTQKTTNSKFELLVFAWSVTGFPSALRMHWK